MWSWCVGDLVSIHTRSRCRVERWQGRVRARALRYPSSGMPPFTLARLRLSIIIHTFRGVILVASLVKLRDHRVARCFTPTYRSSRGTCATWPRRMLRGGLLVSKRVIVIVIARRHPLVYVVILTGAHRRRFVRCTTPKHLARVQQSERTHYNSNEARIQHVINDLFRQHSHVKRGGHSTSAWRRGAVRQRSMQRQQLQVWRGRRMMAACDGRRGRLQ